VVPTLSPPLPKRPSSTAGCVVIGASTGGPGTLVQVLAPLGRDFPLPIVVVQHLALGFVQHLANWLKESGQLQVEAASERSRPAPGKVILAPDERHLAFESRSRLALTPEPTQCHYRPSADVLFRSAAEWFGADAIGVILTGMGRDGADGLKILRDAGALTIAQTSESCAVDGMPKAARDLGAATVSLPPEKIAARLVDASRQILLRGGNSYNR
jgi:chemotaxis response regulator CheB